MLRVRLIRVEAGDGSVTDTPKEERLTRLRKAAVNSRAADDVARNMREELHALIRESRGLTQSEIADVCGISRQRVAQIRAA